MQLESKRLYNQLVSMRQKIAEFAQRLRDQRREKPLLGWTLQIGVALFLLGLGFVLSLFLLVRFGAFGPLPTEAQLRDIHNNNASEVYSADGQLLGKYFRQNRTAIDYEQISPFILDALVATEDERFFEHKGIDLRSWVRVLLRTVLLMDASGGGGSTLSQQLVKNLYPRDRGGLLRIPVSKLREMIVARRLERVYTKNELLSLYLNTVPFGGHVYGVEVAAQTFFNTTAREVKIEEAAVLVGMLKANTTYNPVRHPEASQGRRNVVLAQMHRQDLITKPELDSLRALDLIVDYHRDSNNEGIATYFREHLRQKLPALIEQYQKPDGSPYNLYTAGLKIYTTIDSRMQRHAEAAVWEHLQKLQKDFDQHWKNRKPWGSDEVIRERMKKSERYRRLVEAGKSPVEIDSIFNAPIVMTTFSYEGDRVIEMTPLDSIRYYFCLLNAGFLAMEPSTGAVQAWVGGIDHEYFQYDHVKSRRQVGSTFKPIVYANALRKGIEPCAYIENRLVSYSEYEDWRPENADGKYGGVYSMEGGLRQSVNTVAVDLVMRGGVDSVRQLAQALGISSDIPAVPAIALGAAEVALYDMVQVYGTFANRGVTLAPRCLLRSEYSAGELSAEVEPAHAPRRVLAADDVDVMTQLMGAVVDSGSARRLRYAYGLRQDIAGKTGTTQSHADGWFLGYTPKLVAGAWVGGASPRVRFRSLALGQGANTALPIWAGFMRRINRDPAFKGYARATFPPPSLAVQEKLACAPYLEAMPLPVDSLGGLFAAPDNFLRKLDDLLGSFKKDKERPADEARPSSATRRERDEARRQESERIRKKNERTKRKRERKKKRKEKWDQLFKN